MPTQQTSHPYTIVVGVDFSDTGELALEHAFATASRQPGAEPHIVHVANAYGPMLRLELPDDVKTIPIEEASEQLRQYIERKLTDFQSRYQVEFPRAVTHIRVGAAPDEIAQLASDLDADLVVVGTHGRRGVRRVLLGSVAEGVMRLANCPVLVVRPKGHHMETEDVPKIAPPCPRCLEARRQTEGKQLWCEQHAEHHDRRHHYHYVGRNNADTNMPLTFKM